jgi:hypothetical protein
MAAGDYLLPKEAMYPKIARMANPEINSVGREIEMRAKRNLIQARATTEHTKLPEPMVSRQQASGLTDIGKDNIPIVDGYGFFDQLIWMEGGADNRAALAIEMGHDPSGVFGGTETRSPRGLHILGRAAWLTMARRFRR